ncbi:Transcription factor bHLH90 [Sphaceloma murrayae]|uniref:Transcription factor bHLH90 n=1 Tax=Sphaceloma murrayae TaxID=2082308 RepID=A0A2K1QPT1_9PEZI|nr:Transcription factor bHLH90 [Sphaceloma murrayae]
MAREAGRTMPFGYAFGDEFPHISPQPTPPGRPLLDAGEGAMMENFWADPNSDSFNFNSSAFDQFAFADGANMPVWPDLFGDQHSMLSSHYNMSTMSSPVERRPQSSQDQSPGQQQPQIQSPAQAQAYGQRSAGNQAHPQGALVRPQGSYGVGQRNRFDQVQGSSASHSPALGSEAYDESHSGATALVDLLHNARGAMTPHRHMDISSVNGSTSGPFNPHVLSAEHYPPTAGAVFPTNHMQTHAPDSRGLIPAMNPLSGSASATYSRTADHAIPSGLQFASDINFTHPAQGKPFGYKPSTHTLTDDELVRSHMTYSTYSPLTTQTNPTTNGRTGVMAPPSRANGSQNRPAIQRTNTATTTITHDSDEQATKRRRTQSFPQSATQPAANSVQTPRAIKTEVASPRPASTASSPSASHSDSPRPGKSPKSASKRRPSTVVKSGTPGPSSTTKRAKLSDAQRKENHIQSEKRRRLEMKKGYDSLDKLVPSLKAGTLSKAQVLQHTVVFLESLLSGNDIAERKLAEMEAAAARNG